MFRRRVKRDEAERIEAFHSFLRSELAQELCTRSFYGPFTKIW